MLKHSFSSEAFRVIFDYENRKGVDLATQFFPDVCTVTQELQATKKRYRTLKRDRSALTDGEYQNKKQAIGEQVNRLIVMREDLITKELNRIATNIAKTTFRIKLRKVSTPSGKPAYSIDNDASSYFAIKQIQFNLQRLYKVRQSNRYNIIRQLVSVLSNDVPKYLIKTDIDDFYESISRDALLDKLTDDQLLTQTSKKLIQNVFSEYKRLSRRRIGLPRGIGISAYLAELHMRSFDEKIKSHQRVIFYARYVDDIVVVFSPEEGVDISTYWKFLKRALNSRQTQLQFNDGKNGRDNKTKTVDVTVPHNNQIEYLGYRITFGVPRQSPRLDFTSKKLNRYKRRIELVFNEFHRRKITNVKAAKRLLIKRVLFLTGNTRLLNSKRHAMVGIFYSNNLVTEKNSLDALDHFLQLKVAALDEGSLKRRLLQMSFKQGFEQRCFSNFSTSDLSEIVKPWKNES